MFRKRVYTGTATYWLSISWNSCLALTTQLFPTFCLQSQIKKKRISTWPQNSVCRNSSYLSIFLDLNLDVDITTNIYTNLYNPNKWKLILRNKNTAFTSFKSSPPFFIPTTATTVMWEVKLRTAADVWKSQFCLLNKTLFLSFVLIHLLPLAVYLIIVLPAPQISNAGFMVSSAQCESMSLLQSNWNNTNPFWTNVQALLTKIKNSYKGRS